MNGPSGRIHCNLKSYKAIENFGSSIFFCLKIPGNYGLYVISIFMYCNKTQRKKCSGLIVQSARLEDARETVCDLNHCMHIYNVNSFYSSKSLSIATLLKKSTVKLTSYPLCDQHG